MKKHKQVKWYPHYLLNQQIPKDDYYFGLYTEPEIVRVLNYDISDKIGSLLSVVWGSLESYEET